MPIIADYVDIQDLQVTPAGLWYATNAVDLGNNYGWTFGTAGYISVSFCALQDLEGVAPALYFAYQTNGNSNDGNNLNWIFGPPSNSMITMFYP